VKNGAPNVDTVSLYIDGIPNEWSALIIDPDSDVEVSKVTLQGDDETILLVRVRPAPAQGASNTANLWISGVSGNNETVSDTAYLNITRTDGVAVKTDDKSTLDQLKSGIPNTIDFIVENTGDEDKTFDFELDLIDLDQELWDLEISGESSVSIAAGDLEIVSVDITPSDNVIVTDDGYHWSFIVEDQENADVRYNLDVSMNVEAIYRIYMEVIPGEIVLDEGGQSAEYYFTIQNAGNVEAIVEIDFSQNNGRWDVLLSLTNARIEPFSIALPFDLLVTPLESVEDGEKCIVTVFVLIKDRDETEKSLTTSTIFDINEIPVAVIDSIAPSPAIQLENITFEGHGEDEDGEIISYTWVSSVDGELYNGSESVFTTGQLTPGDHTISFRVQDDYDDWSSEVSTTIEVLSDQDNDGIPDIDDDFPDDRNEWSDTDADGVGDNSDAFPSDPAASKDSDGDGYPDEWNVGRTEADSTTRLEVDTYPNDPGKWKEEGERAEGFLPGFNIFAVIGGICISLVQFRKRRISKGADY